MDIKQVVDESRASQNKLELTKLLTYVNEIEPKVILEIGVDKGYNIENYHKMWPEAIIVGVDNNAINVDKSATTHENIEIVEGNSHKTETLLKVKELFLDNPVDFLFIDGDHTYEGVSQDFEMYSPLVREGGIVGFHDLSYDGNEWRMQGVDVQRFWNQLIGDSGCKYLYFWDEINKGMGTGLYYIK